jgi:uncharacterized SAM-binding protein YcdF (DUF218 family)
LRRPRIAIPLIFIPLLTALVLHESLLRSAAKYLVLDAPPQTADAIFVLGGGMEGSRVSKGCELYMADYAPRLYLSGVSSLYGEGEGDLALRFARRQGCASSEVQSFVRNVDSTRDEAREIFAEARRQGFRRILVVTSNFHTRRTQKVFARLQPSDVEAIVIPAPFAGFDPDHWWQQRPMRKVFFMEWLKTIAEGVGGG